MWIQNIIELRIVMNLSDPEAIIIIHKKKLLKIFLLHTVLWFIMMCANSSDY